MCLDVVVRILKERRKDFKGVRGGRSGSSSCDINSVCDFGGLVPKKKEIN